MAGSSRTMDDRGDGIEPTFDSIGSLQTPLVSEVLVVTRKGLTPDAPVAIGVNGCSRTKGKPSCGRVVIPLSGKPVR